MDCERMYSPVAKIRSQYSSNGAAGVHDAEKVKGTEAASVGNAVNAACDFFFPSHSSPLCPILEVEENGIEAEEHEAHGSNEPCVGSLVKCLFVNPHLLLEPLFGDSQRRSWVWYCAEKGDE